jgi:hypothetical protein
MIDGWFYGLEEDVLAEGTIDPQTKRRWRHGPMNSWNSVLSRSLGRHPSLLPPCEPIVRHSGQETMPRRKVWPVGWRDNRTFAASIKREAGSRGTWITLPHSASCGGCC